MPNCGAKPGSKESALDWLKLSATEGVALVEFAVALPLLLVMIVGIFDFGNAFNVKQKVTNAAAAGARFAASLPTDDLSSTPPKSVLAVRDAIDAHLKSEGLNDCGLAGASASGPSGTTLLWTFQSSGTCVAPVTMTVERSSNLSTSLDNINMISTHVAIAYPYTWYFGRVTGLLAGNRPVLPGQILVDAFAPNLD